MEPRRKDKITKLVSSLFVLSISSSEAKSKEKKELAIIIPEDKPNIKLSNFSFIFLKNKTINDPKVVIK